MSFSRHPETNGLTERINYTFQHLLRWLSCYIRTNWTNMLPQAEVAYNATRALGIEHTPCEASFGFLLEEPPYLSSSIRPSIPVSRDASKRLRLLQELHVMVPLRVKAKQG
jgi:hypothetical protein